MYNQINPSIIRETRKALINESPQYGSKHILISNIIIVSLATSTEFNVYTVADPCKVLVTHQTFFELFLFPRLTIENRGISQ